MFIIENYVSIYHVLFTFDTVLPDAIGKLTQLTTLLLNNNQLTTLPDAIGKLTQLTYLNLTWLFLNESVNCAKTLHKIRQLNLSVADEAFELFIHY